MQQTDTVISQKQRNLSIPKLDVPDIVTLIMAMVVAYQMIQGMTPDAIAIGIVMGGVGKNVYGVNEVRRSCVISDK